MERDGEESENHKRKTNNELILGESEEKEEHDEITSLEQSHQIWGGRCLRMMMGPYGKKLEHIDYKKGSNKFKYGGFKKK